MTLDERISACTASPGGQPVATHNLWGCQNCNPITRSSAEEEGPVTDPITHQGPHPDHGGLTTHTGARENCSAPDCGPPDPEEEIREAVLLLDDCTAPIPTGIGRLLAKLLHEIAEDWGPQLDRRQAIHQAAHKIATSIRQSDAAGDACPECAPTTPDTTPADYTDAETAFIQVGTTPVGGRAELHIEGQPPLVGRYCGAGMRRDQTSKLMIIEPVITVAWTDTDRPQNAGPNPAPAAPQPPAATRPDLTVRLVSISPSAAGIVEELRAAATVLREHLADPELTPAPWLSMCRGGRLVHAGLDHDRRPPVYVVDEPMSNGANADYIALMDPGVGQVIAKWLEDSAAWVVQLVESEDAEAYVVHALATARLINGRPR